jgi:hypothetical protein
MNKARRTLIQMDSSSVIKAMIERIKTLSSLDHRLTKGELRELFVSDVLKKFLSTQFDIGSGIIINHRGDQSKQTDIVIYDKRILPPFIKEQSIGVYPAESVIATLEVKSNLRRKDLESAESAAKHLHNTVYNSEGYLYQSYPLLNYKPLCGIIAFYGTGARELSAADAGQIWLNDNIVHLFLICITGKYSWAKVGTPKPNWGIRKGDKNTHEEVKRIISILLDNIRTLSELRLAALSLADTHYDWLSIYLRDQDSIRDFFNKPR